MDLLHFSPGRALAAVDGNIVLATSPTSQESSA